MMDTIGKNVVALLAFIALTFEVTNGKEVGCGDIKIEPLGCYKDTINDRAMGTEILNERDIDSANNLHKQIFKWKRYGEFLNSFICRCAVEARNKGYAVFGAQFFGECWSSKNAHQDYKKHGNSTSCIDKEFKPIARKDFCPDGMGKAATNFVYRIADPICTTAEYKPLGCHIDKITEGDRALPNYILNDRDPTDKSYSNRKIDWKNWDTYLPDLICRCAEKAKARGDDLFAIQYHGECWSGKRSIDNYARYGTSDKCVGLGYNKCHCNDYRCAGKHSTNYVYELVRNKS